MGVQALLSLTPYLYPYLTVKALKRAFLLWRITMTKFPHVNLPSELSEYLSPYEEPNMATRQYARLHNEIQDFLDGKGPLQDIPLEGIYLRIDGTDELIDFELGWCMDDYEKDLGYFNAFVDHKGTFVWLKEWV
jgi:hypothetical protein